MNSFRYFFVLAISIASATISVAARADDIDPASAGVHPRVSLLSRETVRAEVLHAMRDGELTTADQPREAFAAGIPPTAGNSRKQVHEAAIKALRQGEINYGEAG